MLLSLHKHVLWKINNVNRSHKIGLFFYFHMKLVCGMNVVSIWHLVWTYFLSRGKTRKHTLFTQRGVQQQQKWVEFHIIVWQMASLVSFRAFGIIKSIQLFSWLPDHWVRYKVSHSGNCKWPLGSSCKGLFGKIWKNIHTWHVHAPRQWWLWRWLTKSTSHRYIQEYEFKEWKGYCIYIVLICQSAIGMKYGDHSVE